MNRYVLKRQQLIPAKIEDVFSFFEQPHNLERITPNDVHFKIITPRPIKMHVGTVLDYTIRLWGFPVRWTTLIASYDPPHQFSDVAIRSPYSFWHHTHTFVADGQSTVMNDEVHYALPFGLIGKTVHGLLVRRQLDSIFNYRAKLISGIFSQISA